jgi:hypothetical protein
LPKEFTPIKGRFGKGYEPGGASDKSTIKKDVVNEKTSSDDGAQSKCGAASINNDESSFHLSQSQRRGTMSKKHCCSNDTEVKVEVLTLDDGRRAERHVVLDENGNEVVEIFAEEKRPLKLEKRIVREFKNVVSKETHQTIRDGEVAYQEVKAAEPDVPLQVRQRIGVADHAKIVDGDYVRKDEIDKLIADGVVAGVTALMERVEPVVTKQSPVQVVVTPQQQPVIQAAAPQPIFRAQEAVEKTVEEKKKNDMMVNVIMGAIILLQAGFFAYLFLM